MMVIVSVENLRSGDGSSSLALNEMLCLKDLHQLADVSLGGLSGGLQWRTPSLALVLKLEPSFQ